MHTGLHTLQTQNQLMELDRTGSELQEFISRSIKFANATIKRRIVSDDLKSIESILMKFSDTLNHDLLEPTVDLIITSGGTGFGERDCTPEAIRNVIQKEASGLSIAMMTASLQKTPLAALSRPLSGIRDRTLLISLPGSTKGALENLESIINVLPHALDLVIGEKRAAESFHTLINGPHPATAVSSSATQSTIYTSTAVGTDSIPMVSHHPIIHTCTHKSKTHHQPNTSSLKSNNPNQGISKRSRESPYPMIPFSQALSLVLTHSQPSTEEWKSITDPSIIGSILSQHVISNEHVPAYRASMVDGYALIHTDGPETYPVKSGSSLAGDPLLQLNSFMIESGSIMRVTTGAPVPQGSTAVCMVEDTILKESDRDGNIEKLVQVQVSMRENENIRPVGCDVRKGQVVFTKGQRITATGGEIGTLASIGYSQVKVFKKPVVAVLSTGNELLESNRNESVPFGFIRDANRPALVQAIKSHGFQVLDLGISNDSLESLEKTIRDGLVEADVLVTTGGVSMGELDLLKPVLERRLKGEIYFGRVALKPGKPTTFAKLPHPTDPARCKLVFGLPGNPVSALVTFQLFVLPSLKKQSGWVDCEPMRVQVKV